MRGRGRRRGWRCVGSEARPPSRTGMGDGLDEGCLARGRCFASAFAFDTSPPAGRRGEPRVPARNRCRTQSVPAAPVPTVPGGAPPARHEEPVEPWRLRAGPLAPPGNREIVMRRTKSVGTKVTADEYAALKRLANGQRVGEWARDVLLATLNAAAGRPGPPRRSARPCAPSSSTCTSRSCLANCRAPTR